MFSIYIESDDIEELELDDDFIAICKIHLSRHKTLALLGNLGSGRRTLSNQIAARLRKDNPELKIEVFNVFTIIPTDAETMLSTIVIVPDLIKPWYTNTHTKNIIQFLLKLRSDAEENNCFIIATFQNNDWNNIKSQSNSIERMHGNMLSLFYKPFEVVTEIERLREIARKRKNDISDIVLRRICEVDTSIGRPLKLALIMNYQAFRDDEYFTDPILFTMNQLKTLEISDNMRKRVMFKALVFTMLHGGEITKTKLEEALNNALLNDLIQTDDRKKTIQECIKQLINVYIKETSDEQSYKMIHDIITKCTFLAAAKNHHDLLFTKCSYFPLLECIRHQSVSERIFFYGKIIYDHENLQVGVPTHFYQMLAKIFVERNDLMDMLHTVRFFEDKEFQVKWLNAKKDSNMKTEQTQEKTQTTQ